MSTYEETVKNLGEGTARVVGQLWAAVDRGDLPPGDFRDLAARLIAVANERGRAVAELTLQAYLSAATGTVTAPTAGPLVDDAPRLVKALETVAESHLDTDMQLHRLAVAEPLRAAARAFSAGVAREPLVNGWVRGLEADACQLCRWWWREGRVWPSAHPMPTHPGCTCAPIPTVVERVRSTEYTRFLAHRMEAQA